MQDWLTVIIVILIVGVLADGFRRMRAHRRESLRMSRRVADDDGAYGDTDEDLTSSDFPGGGPRVVGVRDTSDLAHVNQNLRQSYAASKMTRGAPKRQAEPGEIEDEAATSLVEQDEASAQRPAKEEREPVLGSLDNLDEDYETIPADRRDDGVNADESDDFFQSRPYQPVGGDTEEADEVPVDEDADELLEEAVLAPEPQTEQRHTQAREPAPEPIQEPKPEPQATAKGAVKVEPEADTAARTAPDEVLVINVMARRGAMFAGPELLDAMLAQGLRFGDMDIFHRHETDDGRGKILFSVANMVVPGTFALEDMDNFESPGISMFLSLPISGDSLAAYNLMAQSAQNIAQMLGGELKDENRSVMTRQTIEHGRQRVLEYERKRRLAKA